MTLLTRGITSSGQGLGYLDQAIQKSEAADKELQNNLNTYNDLLSGVKSGGTYLGQGSRNILNEYARAFESAIDSYAADPSADNEQRVQQIKLQTQDFYNRAVAARQNSLTQLGNVRSNPTEYSISLADAQQEFADIEDSDPSVRFDPTTMTMYVGDGRSEMDLGKIGYYNGSNPLFFEKAAKLGVLQGEGTYANNVYERYKGMIGTDVGKDKFIEAFMETARPSSSAYQETAIYNYLMDEKGVDLTQISNETELVERISEIKNDASELTAALRHMGELEYNYALGIRAAQSAAQVQETYNSLFNRQQMYRGDRDEIKFDKYLGTELTAVPEEAYQDQFLGARGVNTFKTALGADAVVGLKTKNQDGIIEKLRGMNMLADGSMILALDVETPMTDPDTNEELPSQFKREFRIVEPGSELYENVVSYVGSPAIVSSMYEQAVANKARVEKSREDQITSYLYAQSQLDDVPEEYRLPSPRDIAEAQRIDKQEGKTGPSGIERGLTPSTVEAEAGLISRGPFSDGPRQQVTQAEREMDRRFRERIREENPDMTDEEFNSVVAEMNKQGMTIKLSRTRNFLQRLLGRPEADLLRGVEMFNEMKASMEERDLLNRLDPEAQAYRDRFEQIRGRDFKGSRLSNVEGDYGRGVSREYLLESLPEDRREDYESGGGVAVLTNNPGNLRPYAGYTGPVYYNRGDASDPFRVFDTPQAGIDALERDVEVKTKGEGVMGDKLAEGSLPSGARSADQMTIFDVISVYAPSSENNPRRYSKAIAKFAEEKGYPGVTADSLASSLPVEVLVEAIIKVESNQNHRRLTAQGLFGGDSEQSTRT